jgi:hypothetical protein
VRTAPSMKEATGQMVLKLDMSADYKLQSPSRALWRDVSPRVRELQFRP